jgi:hypothetical protein
MKERKIERKKEKEKQAKCFSPLIIRYHQAYPYYVCSVALRKQ